MAFNEWPTKQREYPFPLSNDFKYIRGLVKRDNTDYSKNKHRLCAKEDFTSGGSLILFADPLWCLVNAFLIYWLFLPPLS